MTGDSVTVVGAGPNGLASAVALARAGRSVTVLERASVIGGGTRTEELTLPGFLHDVCSAVHPTGIASPFFNDIGLDVEWIQPEIPVTHPLDGGDVVALFRRVGVTANQFGAEAGRYGITFGSALLVEACSWLIRFVSPGFAWVKIGSFYVLQAALLGLVIALMIGVARPGRNAYKDGEA